MKKIMERLIVKAIEAAVVLVSIVLVSNGFDVVVKNFLDYGMIVETVYYIALGVHVALVLFVWECAERLVRNIILFKNAQKNNYYR